MQRTLKAFSALLSYPSADLQHAAREIRAAVAADGALSARAARDLDRLIDDFATGDLIDLQERYVLLFDRTRSLSLHLFEHVHGESRDRGQAMIDLKNLYESNGLAVSAAELPDFLPLFLEFLSTRPAAEAREMLGQPAHIFSVIAERLRKRGSPYEAVFRALSALPAEKPRAGDVDAVLQEPDPDPMDLAALDAAWEDEPVTFGPTAAAGCKDTIVARIRADRRPPAGPSASSRPAADVSRRT